MEAKKNPARTWRIVALVALCACVALAAFSTMGYFELPFPPEKFNEGLWITCLLVAVFVIIKHKSNIKRLLNGTENGFGSKRKTPKV